MEFQLTNMDVDVLRCRTPSPDCFHAAFSPVTNAYAASMNPVQWNLMEEIAMPTFYESQPMTYLQLSLTTPTGSSFGHGAQQHQLKAKDGSKYSRQNKNAKSSRANSALSQNEKILAESDASTSIPGTPPTDVGSDSCSLVLGDSDEELEGVDSSSLFNMKASLGSVGHPSACAGACKYNCRKGRGCKEGESCNRCHLCFWTRAGERERLERLSQGKK
mmetsp:Transcript_23258/g.37210  ORF Transcript_23258/g.37210 Transcript_23258/m.37210 type:complete len:218 (+) Transcript_23258:49-702(+)